MSLARLEKEIAKEAMLRGIPPAKTQRFGDIGELAIDLWDDQGEIFGDRETLIAESNVYSKLYFDARICRTLDYRFLFSGATARRIASINDSDEVVAEVLRQAEEEKARGGYREYVFLVNQFGRSAHVAYKSGEFDIGPDYVNDMEVWQEPIDAMQEWNGKIVKPNLIAKKLFEFFQPNLSS